MRVLPDERCIFLEKKPVPGRGGQEPEQERQALAYLGNPGEDPGRG